MFRLFCLAACFIVIAAAGAQAAVCDPAAEEKEINQLLSASPGMNAKLLESVLGAMVEVNQLSQKNKLEEACAAAAKIKEMIPK